MPEQETTGPASRVYFSQRLRLHYVDWGNAEAPPLILLHGGQDHCRNWDWVAQRLRHDWHIVAPDLARLIDLQRLAPVTIVGHSLGGNIALRYAGIYPEKVKALVSIEGLGPSPKALAERAKQTIVDRMRTWIDLQHDLAGRLPRRYASIEDAFRRMQEANKHLSPEQARHLTQHGVKQNEDGSFSWKFDNYLRVWAPYDMQVEELRQLWHRITCPTLLVYGTASFASNPQGDGRAQYFQNARVVNVEGAGHWVHHDRLDAFIETLREFLI
jgi:pimeloyl-ACP methyl ester carboxylesterase